MDEKHDSRSGHAPEVASSARRCARFCAISGRTKRATHFRNSRVEFLKGVRSLLDDRIEHLSRRPEQKGQRVTVE